LITSHGEAEAAFEHQEVFITATERLPAGLAVAFEVASEFGDR
jgi:hypothetical protein